MKIMMNVLNRVLMEAGRVVLSILLFFLLLGLFLWWLILLRDWRLAFLGAIPYFEEYNKEV